MNCSQSWPLIFFCKRGDGHDDGVVLVLTHARLSLGSEQAHHLERQVADADRLSDRVRRAEQVLAYGVAEHCHVGRAVSRRPR